MAKIKALRLSIPEPCHEDWDKMTPIEQGRHCQSCNKTVIDFSIYTDKQLIEFFTKVKDNVCGQLSRFQVERQLIQIEHSRYPFLQKLLFGTVLTAGIIGSANANYNPNNKPILEQFGINEIGTQNSDKNTQLIPGGDSTNYVECKVIDEYSHQIVSFASVTIRNIATNVVVYTATTDTNGVFRYSFPDKLIDSIVVIEVTSEGYNNQKIDLRISKNTFKFIIGLTSIKMQIRGGVVSTEYYIDGIKKPEAEMEEREKFPKNAIDWSPWDVDRQDIQWPLPFPPKSTHK